MVRGRSALFALVAASLVASPARAQERNLDVERFRPAPDRSGFLGLPGSATPGPWGWNVSLFTGYSLEPLTLRRRDDGTRLPIVAHRIGADLIAQLGITDRIAAVVDLPVVVWQDTNAAPLGSGGQLAALALRDPYLSVRVRVLGEGSTIEHDDEDEGGLALSVATTLPFGLEHSFAGEGSPQLEGSVIGNVRFLLFSVGATVGYRHRFAEPSLLGVRFANELFFGVAVQGPLVFVENTSVIVELRVDTALDDGGFLGESTAGESDVGVRWAEGDVALTWIVGTGFTGGVGTPAVRGLFGLEWAPRTHDADGDGMVDSRERPDCVHLPEDLDGFEDDDGCADPDNDGDLVPDTDDRCPNEAADLDRDEDEDGCTDPVRDADADGVPDDEDACPRRAEDADGFEDEDGCPDLDDDGDGTPDARDRCPREAEDADGFEDEDGCPDPDDDGDGVSDADDRCPREAEDRDGFEDEDGCPDPDDDRDGVLDADDRCPDARETIDGVEDADGCPDRGGRSLWVPRAETGAPVLRGRVRFDRDGSVARASAGAVDQLARHLIAGWGTRWRVAIAPGGEGREAALAAALTSRGVPAERFDVVLDEALGGATVEARGAPRSGDLAAPAP